MSPERAEHPGRPHQARPAEASDPVDVEIERLLAEAETTVTRLRAELERARSARAVEREQEEQHAEVERLEAHLSNAQVHWTQVRDFFRAALAEIHSSTGQDPTAPTAPTDPTARPGPDSGTGAFPSPDQPA